MNIKANDMFYHMSYRKYLLFKKLKLYRSLPDESG